MQTETTPTTTIPAALVWLDHWHALVARAYASGVLVTEIDRAVETEPDFLFHVAEQAENCDRLVVMGPEASRAAFEREYVALYRRPDRLIDAGMELEPQPHELIDRLRILDLGHVARA